MAPFTRVTGQRIRQTGRESLPILMEIYVLLGDIISY